MLFTHVFDLSLFMFQMNSVSIPLNLWIIFEIILRIHLALYSLVGNEFSSYSLNFWAIHSFAYQQIPAGCAASLDLWFLCVVLHWCQLFGFDLNTFWTLWTYSNISKKLQYWLKLYIFVMNFIKMCFDSWKIIYQLVVIFEFHKNLDVNWCWFTQTG